MFNFASKMLNTIMGTEEQQGQGQGPGQQQLGPGMQQGHSVRPMGGFPQVRPSPQLVGQRPYGGPPSFTGPRPSPGLVRGAPPNFGGMARPMGAPGPGTPHRFNGPQPPVQQMPRGMMPAGSQVGMVPRGPGPPGAVVMPPLSPMPMRQRAPQPRQPFQQQAQPALQLAGAGGSSGVAGAPVPDLDLSHLSAEERAMIENVMAKAQQLEQDAPPAPVPQTSSLGQPGPSRMMRPEDQRGSGYDDYGGVRLCPLCRQRDLSGRDGHLAQECAECGTLVCNRCGGLATHPETKRPEWTCGNCIKRRRTGAMSGSLVGPPPGQHGAGVRPLGPSPFHQQQPPTMEWENERRGSGGSASGIPGRSQQRWENERESDTVENESKAIKIWESDEVERGDLSSETSLSPQEWTGAHEEPVRGSSRIPVDIQYTESINPSTSISPDHTLSMSTPISASASKAKPSFVNLHSRSVSLDSAEDEGVRPLHDNGFHVTSPPLESFELRTSAPATTSFLPAPIPDATPNKANALMEELSKLQSAVESYNLKRRERELQEPEASEDPFPQHISPSISLSPRESPSLSPLPSPTISNPCQRISPPDKESPESPELEFPEPRKAIVLRDNELEDYRSSTDEESESDSDDERKGLAEDEVVSFYDHSPGEVYTIHEEEDEGGSPTGGDLVTSLNRIQGSVGDSSGIPRRRMMGQECLPGVTMPPDQRHSIRPQLRPQRSLDNRLPSMPHHPQSDLNQMDRHGNMSYSNNNVTNTQLQNQMANMEMQDVMGQPSISSLTGHQLTSTLSSTKQSFQDQQQQQQQPNYSTVISSGQQQMEVGLGTMQGLPHQAQLIQKTVDNLSEWNNNMSMSMGDHTGTGHVAGPPLDQSMPVSSQQSYQQQQSQQQQQTQQQHLQQQQAQQQHQPSTSVYGQLQSQYQMGLPQQQADLQPQQPHMYPQGLGQQQDPPNPQQVEQQHLIQSQQQLQPQQPFQMQQQQPYQTQQTQAVQTQQQLQQFQSQQSFQSQSQIQAQAQVQQFQSQQQQLHQQQLQAQQLHEQQIQAQQLQMQTPASQHQLGSMTCGVQGGTSAYSTSHTWPQQPIFDQTGRSISSPSTSHPQFPQQSHQQPQSQYQQGQLHVQQPTPLSMTQQGQSHLNIITTQAGPGHNKSISGLLADFSRALGLGSTSPRPSPSDEKELFALQAAESQHGQMLSPYEQYLQHQQQPHGGISHPVMHPPQSQHVQSSAFASIQDPNQMFMQQKQNQQISQQYPYQQQAQLGMQNLPHGVQTSLQVQSQPFVSQQSQQYAQTNMPNHQQTQVMTQAGIMTQQQAASLGVGVVGALSPAQAHMYQQQMALQHQAQHMKKSRRAHLTGSAGDMRRDGGTSTVYIGGVGALTPAVVTSLGTFIGGAPAIIGTSLLQQPLSVTPLGTPLGSDPVGTPRSARDAGDSSDTMSETDSQKSLRMRRKLPCLPPDQEAAPLPSTKKRERQRAQETFRSLSPMRMSTFDNNLSRSYPLSSFGLSRPSASESNLRKISGMGISDQIPRPGSALGLLQGSSVVSNIASKSETVYPLSGSMFSTTSLFPGMRLRSTHSGYTTIPDMTTTTSVLSGLYPSYKTTDEWSSNLAELAACLPPDLRHLLNKGDADLSLGLSGISNLTSGLGETNLNVGSHLPTYMRTLREQLQEERRQLLSDERRRLEALRERDRELGARLDAVTSRAGSERSRTDLTRDVGISRSAGASPVISRKVKGHRRQLSDPKLSLPFSPIQEAGDHELQDFDRSTAGILRSQYKSLEYESLEDSDLLRPVSGMGEWDRSQSYLASSWATAGGVLRETAINSMGMVSDDDDFRYRVSSRFMPRRSSDGEAWSLLAGSRSHSLSRDKKHQVRKHRKSRSWHPSPYVSEDDDEEIEENINREEKKARIKAEIARRRQQIQERAGIHQELMRMSRVRDGTEHDRHSVLKSVDQLIRDQYGQGRFDPHAMSNSRHAMIFGRDKYGSSMASGVISPCASEEDRSIERIASTFRSDDYTSLLYDRLGEMSPLATDSESMGSELASTPAAMPILPDMPTTYRDRSRRLLEDIGRTDGGHRHREGPGGNLKGRSADVGQFGMRRRRAIAQSEQFPNDVFGGVGGLSRRDAKNFSSNQVTSHCTNESDASPLPGRKSQAPIVQEVQAQASESEYSFPVKKFFLTKDPKDRSVGGNGFGIRIVGGKEIPLSGGRISAYVSKIYPGTFSETLTDVYEGDAVLEWNGISLDNKTFEEVQSIFGNDSSGEVEIVLRSNFNVHTGKPRLPCKIELNGYDSSRNSGSNLNLLDEISNIMSPENTEVNVSNKEKDPDSTYFSTCTMTSEMIKPVANKGGVLDDKICGERRYSDQIKSPSTSVEATSIETCSLRHSVVTEGFVSEYSTIRTSRQRKSLETEIDMIATSPPLLFLDNELRNTRHGSNGKQRFSNGQIQLQICHDPKANILYVTILKAKLPKQQNEDGTDHVQVDPYVVVYLLPERILENQRRTRHLPMSFSPLWNQTMVYPNVSASDLGNKILEVSAWNHNSIGEDTLFGKVILQLSVTGILDEQPHSYTLKREEKGDKSKSRQRLSKCGNTIGKSIGMKRSSQSASWEESNSRRGVPERISIFQRGNMQAQNVLPTDCHGGFCIIL